MSSARTSVWLSARLPRRRCATQGTRATVRLDVLEADDPHHAWEAAFRAFGRALRFSLASNPWRAGLTAGVKGTLD